MKHYFNENKTKVLIELSEVDLYNIGMYINLAEIHYAQTGLSTANRQAGNYWIQFYKIEKEMENATKNRNHK